MNYRETLNFERLQKIKELRNREYIKNIINFDISFKNDVKVKKIFIDIKNYVFEIYDKSDLKLKYLEIDEIEKTIQNILTELNLDYKEKGFLKYEIYQGGEWWTDYELSIRDLRRNKSVKDIYFELERIKQDFSEIIDIYEVDNES